MSIPISSKVASYNAAQLVKFKNDPKPNEGRLGVWIFDYSFYYVSSTQFKISKIWFDFLRLIGLVIDHTNAAKYENIRVSTTRTFDKIDAEFYEERNTETENEITKLRSQLSKRDQEMAQLKVDKEESRASKETLQTKLNDLNQVNQKLKDELQVTQNLLALSTKALETERVAKKKLEEQFAGESKTHRGQIDNLHATVKEKEKIIEEQAKKLTEAQKEVEQLQVSHASLNTGNDQHAENLKEKEKLANENKTLKTESEKLANENKTLKTESEKIKLNNKQYEENIQKLNHDYQEKHAVYELWKKNFEEQQKQLKDLQSKVPSKDPMTVGQPQPSEPTPFNKVHIEQHKVAELKSKWEDQLSAQAAASHSSDNLVKISPRNAHQASHEKADEGSH
jgi:myosin heavy subunit